METTPTETPVNEAETETKKQEKPYSGRKTFAFSDESQYQTVEQILAQKPKELTNGDVLVQALKLFVEKEEMHQSLNHLPQTATDIFKGDLAKLDVAFETIRSVFSTQMKSSTELILQREANLQRKYETLLTQKDTQLEVANKQIELLAVQNEDMKTKVDYYQAQEVEWNQTKHTVATLQQALQNEQQRTQTLEYQVQTQEQLPLEALKQEIQTLQAQIQTLEGVHRELVLKNEHLQSEKQSLQQELQTKSEQLQQAETERLSLQDRLLTTTRESQERIERLVDELVYLKVQSSLTEVEKK